MKKLKKNPKPIKEKRSYRAKGTVINVEWIRVFNQINQWRMKMKRGWREGKGNCLLRLRGGL
ncbi:hypothetical protein PanWU01x14_101610 [Parasponia andersonii]|uniref:Uncharacterized protein n=1 Tax=Parasponia andersonii TaxID=3476 RepID=A0A2P5D366_PARAD|nr:hypothetical protein PanWU01x14_101610 [Parasponia andersonii]